MKKHRRAFLGELFEAELSVMKEFYHGKKKHKKIYKQLSNLKQQRLEKLIDDYFYNVCAAFYAR